MTKLSG